jgi:glycosyltransferase involved in cell wall biosynthesis
MVFSNLSWSDQIAERLRPRGSGLPGWFAYAIVLAGYTFRCDMNPARRVLSAVAGGNRITLLCFNPSFIYGLLFLLPLPINRVSLFQWRPIGRLSWLKSAFVQLTLCRSHAIVVYSHITARYLRRYFPGKRIRQIGLYVDTEYFRPALQQSLGGFIFAPGDHKRDERLLSEVARRLGTRIVRVTRNPAVRDAVERLNSREIELRFNVSFDELRNLYQQCRCVLILSDSSEIPTGITSLAEALACGADVVISRGSSNSWPRKMADALPFTTISQSADASVVATAICALDPDPSQKEARSRNARDFALRQLSGPAVARQWNDVLDPRGTT